MRMKKIRFLLLTLVALLGTVNAAAKTVYIQPGNWANDNAVISLNVWGDGENTWADLTEAGTGIFKATVGDGKTTMAVVRAKQGYGNTWKNDDQTNVWNQTGDITFTDGKLYKLYDYENNMDGIYVGHGVVEEDYTEPVSAGYTMDFNTTITTSKSGWVVGKNWGHIIDGSVTYSYDSKGGVTGEEGDGALTVYGQNSGSDLLVTPKVSGTITLQVKQSVSSSSSNHAFVNFYSVNADATEKDALLDSNDLGYRGDGSSSTDWQTITLEVTGGQRIAIHAQYVTIDNFTATSVELVDESKLEIASAVPTATTGTIYWEQQPNGKVLVSFTVTVTNTGDATLTTGDENYSISIINASNENAVVATVDVPQTLAAGETSDPFVVSAELETSLWSDNFTYNTFNLKENITGTTIERAQSHYTEYTPKFLFLTKGSSITNSTNSIDEEQKFGIVKTEAVTKAYQISNNGIAPLTIKSITVSKGFETDAPTTEFTIDRKTAEGEISSREFNITLPATEKGIFSGNLKIVYLDKNGAEQTYTVALSGQVIGNAWSCDFGTASLSVPEGSVISSTTLYGGYTGSYSAADGYLKSYNRRDYNMFITPKLHAAAGDKLSFDALNYQTGSAYYIKVYVSKDRSIWATEYSSSGNPEWGEPVKTVMNSDLAEQNVRESYSIDVIPEEGDYYVAFEVYGTGLDNIIGFEKQETPEHDIYFKSYTLPSEVEENTAITAKATIIPLTSEAADDYTVKYYVGTEAVATATSVALTQSLTSSTSKDFSFSYTPTEVGNYDTYIAFEFTDDTVIETPHQTLKVKPGSPEFHFLASGAWVSTYWAPSNLNTNQDYGIVNTADGSKTFYLFNYGSAPLKVKSVTVPEGFSSDFPAEGVTIAAYDKSTQGYTGTATFESAYPFNITFSTETPGAYEGTVSVTYVDLDDEFKEVDVTWTSTFKLKGTMLDPTKYYTNIGTAKDQFPAGSLAQANVSSETKVTGDASLVSSSATKNLFITPKLKGEENEVLTFDAMLRSSYFDGTIKVYLVDDHIAAANTTSDEEFNELNPTLVKDITISKSEGSDSEYTNYSVKMPKAGEYYVAFKFEDARIDNIYGLSLADVAHEWILGDVNVPTEAMQNVPSSATVNILNIGLQAETDYTVVAYVNGVATETAGTTTIPTANKLTATPTAVPVAFKSPKAGTYPVYFEIKAGDYSVATAPVEVTFAEEEASGDLATGESAGTDGTIPLNLYYKNSETIALYTPANLGLNGGEKIKSITWKGYTTSAHTSTLKVYYQWTDETSISAPSSTSNYSVQGMTAAIEPASHTWTVGGSASELQDQIVVNFDTPITYESGKSLLILVSSSASGYSSSSSAIQFEKSNITGFAYQHQNDGDEGKFTGSWSAKNLPLIHIAVDVQPTTLSGTVKDGEDAAVEGATVTLVSTDGDNVQYSGTTDSEGAYSINVIQAAREYNVTVTKEGLPDATATVAFNGESKTQNFYMVEPVVVTFVNGAGWDKVYAYTWSYDEATETTTTYSAAWPGTEISKTGTTTIQGAEYDVYTYSLQTPTAPAKIIFNNGNSGDGNQTDNLDFTNGAQFVYGITYYSVAGAFRADGTEEDVAGIFGTAWATELNDMTKNADGLYELSFTDVELAKGTIKFKVLENHAWDNSYPSSDYTVYIAKAGTYSLTITFDASSKNVSHKLYYTLAEDNDGIAAMANVTVTVARQFKAGWNAVVLPFALSADEVTEAFGENSELAVYDGDTNNDGNVTVKFKKISGEDKYISAGYPYMLWLENAVSGLKFTKDITTETSYTSGTTFDFVGVYTQTTTKNGDYIVQGGEFRKANESNYVLPFRAYLKLKEGQSAARSIRFVIGDVDQTTTEIAGLEIEGQRTVEGVYNLQGQKVQNMNRKGLYIINGKKVMVK